MCPPTYSHMTTISFLSFMVLTLSFRGLLEKTVLPLEVEFYENSPVTNLEVSSLLFLPPLSYPLLKFDPKYVSVGK